MVLCFLLEISPAAICVAAIELQRAAARDGCEQNLAITYLNAIRLDSDEAMGAVSRAVHRP